MDQDPPAVTNRVSLWTEIAWGTRGKVHAITPDGPLTIVSRRKLCIKKACGKANSDDKPSPSHDHEMLVGGLEHE